MIINLSFPSATLSKHHPNKWVWETHSTQCRIQLAALVSSQGIECTELHDIEMMTHWIQISWHQQNTWLSCSSFESFRLWLHTQHRLGDSIWSTIMRRSKTRRHWSGKASYDRPKNGNGGCLIIEIMQKITGVLSFLSDSNQGPMELQSIALPLS